jgi:GTP-binding protein
MRGLLEVGTFVLDGRSRRDNRVVSSWYGMMTALLVLSTFAFAMSFTSIDHSSTITSTARRRRIRRRREIIVNRQQFTNNAKLLLSVLNDDEQHKASANLVVDTTSTSSTIAITAPTISSQTPSSSSSSTITNEYSFFDEATIYVRAGSGGQGSSTYKKDGKSQNGPPDGGDGGRGGDVILQIDTSTNTLAGLSRYTYRPNAFGGGGAASTMNRRRGAAGWVLSFRAENGWDGERQNRRGRNGKDVIVRVPPGTIVQEEIVGGVVNEMKNMVQTTTTTTTTMITTAEHPPVIVAPTTYIDHGTITRENPTLIIASGGTGGDGSGGPADKSQPRGIRTPRMPPAPGERKRLKLTLKVVADVALVAVPNAGKSTLLGKVTRAKPKIADYPFTTVVPNLGVWVPPYNTYNAHQTNSNNDNDMSDDDYNDNNNDKSLVLCDVPGLIAGASEGIGLGHAFLRHVERCHVILHLLDATSTNILEEYAMINRELMNYGTGKLATMPQVVVVNKVDTAFEVNDDTTTHDKNSISSDGRRFRSKEELENELLKVMPHSRLMWISAKEGDGVDELMERVAMFVGKVKGTIAAEEAKQRQLLNDQDEEETS